MQGLGVRDRIIRKKTAKKDAAIAILRDRDDQYLRNADRRGAAMQVVLDKHKWDPADFRTRNSLKVAGLHTGARQHGFRTELESGPATEMEKKMADLTELQQFRNNRSRAVAEITMAALYGKGTNDRDLFGMPVHLEYLGGLYSGHRGLPGTDNHTFIDAGDEGRRLLPKARAMGAQDRPDADKTPALHPYFALDNYHNSFNRHFRPMHTAKGTSIAWESRFTRPEIEEEADDYMEWGDPEGDFHANPADDDNEGLYPFLREQQAFNNYDAPRQKYNAMREEVQRTGQMPPNMRPAGI